MYSLRIRNYPHVKVYAEIPEDKGSRFLNDKFIEENINDVKFNIHIDLKPTNPPMPKINKLENWKYPI